jgi:hypothetical protein
MILQKQSKGFIEIDLTTPQGNVFYLLGVAKTLCQGLGISFSEVKQKMCSSDYENAINVFDNYFGDFVILYR